MIDRLNKNLESIEISGIRKFNQLASNYQNVIKLTLGEPDFFVPDEIKEATIEAIKTNKSRYTQNQGIPELRIKVANYIESKVDHSYTSENIIITVGATGALQVTLSSILNKNDEVILLTPAYPGYEPLIKLNGATTKYVDAITGIDENQLLSSISEKSKAIIITSPSNPTGYVYSQDDFDLLFKIAKEHSLFIIWDAIYLDLVYKELEPITIPKELDEHVILIGGFSKSHSMTGYRLGFLAASDQIRNELLKTQQYSVTSSSSIVQYAGLKALDVDNYQMVQSYKKRRDFLTKFFDEYDISYIEPNGAFYLFVDISKFNVSSVYFATKLLDQQQVACVPGKYFTGEYDKYIRISYATSLNNLEVAMTRFKIFISQFKK
jgi:aminotransferase